MLFIGPWHILIVIGVFLGQAGAVEVLERIPEMRKEGWLTITHPYPIRDMLAAAQARLAAYEEER